MATLITEPSQNSPQTADWQKNLEKITKLGGGFALAYFSNMDNANAPAVLAGSRFEINGSFYQCITNESIIGTPTNNAVNFVYAIPNGQTCSFQYSSTAPTFQATKGGWFNGNNRAILKFSYSSSQYNDKRLLVPDIFEVEEMDNKVFNNIPNRNITSAAGTENKTLLWIPNPNGSGQGTPNKRTESTSRTITAGTRTLQALLALLVGSSHSHTLTDTNCNCNCDCNCCDGCSSA